MGAAHFAQEVAMALAPLASRIAFLTAISPDGHDPLAWLLRQQGTSQRRVKLPAGSELKTHPWREVIRLAHGKLDPDEIRRDAVFHWALYGFDRWVASTILKRKLEKNGNRSRLGLRLRNEQERSSKLGLVYGYETMCLETFRAAKKSGVKTVLDLPSPEHDYVENLLWREYEKFPALLTPARRRFRELQAERTARRHEEFRLADLVVANSSLTARTWAAAGLDGKKIVTVPLAGPEPDPRGPEGGTRGRGALKMVWAGTFSVRKGAHLLVEAWRGWKGRGGVELDVYGSVSLPEGVKIRDLEGVRFHGPVPRERVLAAFREADLLVFPTLCDGFGLVVAEALAQGLPVLTTREAGAADLIREGENGFLMEAASVEVLRGKLEEIRGQKQRLIEMCPACLRTAQGNSRAKYQAHIRKVVSEINDG
jgi:glycosyltransferase involved in cell wall biosynthesis